MFLSFDLGFDFCFLIFALVYYKRLFWLLTINPHLFPNFHHPVADGFIGGKFLINFFNRMDNGAVVTVSQKFANFHKR